MSASRRARFFVWRESTSSRVMPDGSAVVVDTDRQRAKNPAAHSPVDTRTVPLSSGEAAARRRSNLSTASSTPSAAATSCAINQDQDNEAKDLDAVGDLPDLLLACAGGDWLDPASGRQSCDRRPRVETERSRLCAKRQGSSFKNTPGLEPGRRSRRQRDLGLRKPAAKIGKSAAVAFRRPSSCRFLLCDPE